MGKDKSLVRQIPASVWLNSIEPSLPILVKLRKIKHRRSNLSLPKQRSPVSESSEVDSGDFEAQHWPFMIGPPVRHIVNNNQIPDAIPMNDEIRASRFQNLGGQVTMNFLGTYEMPVRTPNRLRYRGHLRSNANVADNPENINQSANPTYLDSALPPETLFITALQPAC
ncbi:hypothetical protein ScPMuIL_013237 [Solemya velum]